MRLECPICTKIREAGGVSGWIVTPPAQVICGKCIADLNKRGAQVSDVKHQPCPFCGGAAIQYGTWSFEIMPKVIVYHRHLCFLAPPDDTRVELPYEKVTAWDERV